MIDTPPAPTAHRTYSAALEALKSKQKSGAGVPGYTRWLNRRGARYLAAGAYRLGLSPDAVTMLSAAVSLSAMAALMLAPRTPLLGIAVAAGLALGYLLDSADGQVARLSGRGGPAGEWLDHVVDSVRMPALHVSVAVALYLHEGRSLLALLALGYALLTVGQFFSQILAEQLARNSGHDPVRPQGSGITQSIVLLPTDTGVLCWIFVLWGFSPVFAVAYAAMFALNAGHTAISMSRKRRHLQSLSKG